MKSLKFFSSTAFLCSSSCIDCVFWFEQMGKKHTASRKRHARKRPKFSFRNLPEGSKSPTVVVADYIFGDDHGDSSVSWLMRKLDRYKNDSSFTSSVSSVGEEGEDTATSRLPSDLSHPTEEEPTCKKNQFQEESGDACNNIVDIPNVDDFACNCEGPCVWLADSGSPSRSSSPTYQLSESKLSSPSTSSNPGSKN